MAHNKSMHIRIQILNNAEDLQKMFLLPSETLSLIVLTLLRKVLFTSFYYNISFHHSYLSPYKSTAESCYDVYSV